MTAAELAHAAADLPNVIGQLAVTYGLIGLAEITVRWIAPAPEEP